MNFWEAQRRARSKTGLYVTIFVILTIITAIISEYALRYFAQDNYNPPFPYFGLLFLGITFFVAGFQYLMFRTNGGRYVAESVGAWEVDPLTTHPKERQLLNIVEEVALASSLPVPPVYILDANEINAFAAGTSPNDAAITVTVGSLQVLNRDELQGVIAHECGHIHNGDMVISMRLAAMVMGFFFVLYIGMRILQFAGFGRRNDDRKGGNPVVLGAIIFIVAGSFTWLMGQILKSAVSREREYLADACAVQFTRNPNGIANALRKIANEQVHDMPHTGSAFSHMYLEDTTTFSSLFATHPPIEKRIAALEGREYIPDEWKIPK